MAKIKDIFYKGHNNKIPLSDHIQTGKIIATDITSEKINIGGWEGQLINGYSTTTVDPSYGLQAQIVALQQELAIAKAQIQQLEQELEQEREKMIEI